MATHVNALARKFSRKIRYWPFNFYTMISQAIDEYADRVLDVGCGSGGTLAQLARRVKFSCICGVDIYLPYLYEAKDAGLYSDLVLADARYLPFKEKSFDTILCIEVIEHLRKDQGVKLLKKLESLSKRKIVITTPAYFFPQNSINGNPHQVHLLSWHPNELRSFGFKCRGHGLRCAPNKVVERSFCVISYLLPEIATHIVAVKKLDFEGARINWLDKIIARLKPSLSHHTCLVLKVSNEQVNKIRADEIIMRFPWPPAWFLIF